MANELDLSQEAFTLEKLVWRLVAKMASDGISAPAAIRICFQSYSLPDPGAFRITLGGEDKQENSPPSEE